MTRSSAGPGTHVGRLVADAVVAGAGLAVGAAFGAATRVRQAKPIHTRGAVLHGRLHRDGTGRSGVGWIDAEAEDDVVVRLSRAAGLPAPWPDVHGLAVRCEGDGTDVLLSTTGRARVSRHVLRPGLDPGRGTYTSLLPYRGPYGAVLLAAEPTPPRSLPADPDALADALTTEPMTFTLAWADLRSPWQPFGTLVVGGRVGPTDVPLRFDPIRTPGDLHLYRWVTRLREPAYAAARRHHPVDVGSLSAVVPTQRSVV